MPALAATPVANDDAYSTPLDTALIVPAPGIFANDTDADGDSLTATNVVVFGPGSFSVNGLSGALTYNPPVGFTGVARMTYQVTDGTTTSGTATVLVAVQSAGGNSPPIARDDTYSTLVDTPITIPAPGILGNDLDLDGGPGALGATNVVVFGPGSFTINGFTGAITYSPPAGFTGAATMTYSATDGNLTSSPATVTVNVVLPPAPTLVPLPPMAAQVGVPFSQQITATGTGPITYLLAGGTIPPGLALPATGLLSGTPTTAGTYIFSAIATNVGGASAPQTYVVTVDPAPPITIAPVVIASGTAGVSYSQQFTASGGDGGPYTYAVTAGALPSGISLSPGGLLSGTTTVTGTFNFTLTVDDGIGGSGSRAYSITIAAPPPVSLTPLTLPDGQTGVAYAQQLTASGGIGGPYTYALAAGTPPVGITLSGSGLLSGTAAAAGTSNFSVLATDGGGNTATNVYTLTIAALPPVVIAPPTLPDGQVGTAYFRQLTASGGDGGPYSFAVTAGALPAGISLAADGLLMGTPTSAGTSNFTVTVTDGVGGTAALAYVLTIAAPTPVVITPATLPGGQVGVAYSQAISATGGVGGPYTFSVTGSLPPGLSLTAGTLVGTPLAAGDYTFTVTATDPVLTSGSRTYTVGILAARPTAPNLTATVPAGSSVSVALTEAATGGPFSSASILSSLPAAGGTATLGNAPNYTLTFAAGSTFSGTVVVTYTLTGPGGVSDPATVTVTVEARPDPSQDPDVVGLLTAQAQAAQQFAAGQMYNISQRIAGLHAQGCDQAFSSGISVGSIVLPDLGAGCGSFSKGGKTSDLRIWAGGFIDLGQFDEVVRRDYVSINLTAGMDYRFSPRFIAGVALGYGSDRSDIGDNGTTTSGDAYSATLYASYRLMPNLFVTGLGGYGVLGFDSQRFDTTAGTFATGQRDGEQVFGAVTMGYEARVGALRLVPFGEVAASSSTLDAFTETGAGIYSLSYGEQTVDSVAGTIGISGSTDLPLDLGVLTPSFKLAYTHEFAGSSDVDIRYADLTDGFVYGVRALPFATDQVTLGLGAQLTLPNQIRFGWTYSGSFGFEGSQSHSIGLRVGGRY